MSFQFKLPQISGNDPSVQISSIQQYLYKLVEELNHSMNVLDSSITETSEKIVATEKKNKQTTEAEAQASFDSLKGLIIKSADIVNAYYQKMKLRFDGVYTAQSVFGDFVEQTNTAIELANNGIAVNTQSIGVINSNIVEMEDDIEALDDDVNGANGLTPRMQIAESNITTNANNITLKVAQSEYDTDMASVNAAIATKASAQDLSTLAGRVSTAESTISQQADQIALRVTTETYNGGISNLQGQVDGKIESWHYNYVPTTTNYPASEWTTAVLKEKHKGDLFYNTDSGYMYRYEILEPKWSQLNGINWSELGNVTWEDLIDEYGEYGWKEVLDANSIEKVINESSITIDGDRINIQADNIHLEGYTTVNEGFSIDQQGNMTANNGTFSGNVYLQGNDSQLLIGGNGVLNHLQYNAKEVAELGYSGQGVGWVWDDFNLQQWLRCCLSIDAYIPQGFTMTGAYITLFHRPMKCVSGTVYVDGQLFPFSNKVQSGEGLALFVNSSSGRYEYIENDVGLGTFAFGTEITDAFGLSGWTPSSDSTEQHKTSGDIKSHLTTGTVNRFVIGQRGSVPSDPTNLSTYLATFQKNCILGATLDIFGYATNVQQS